MGKKYVDTEGVDLGAYSVMREGTLPPGTHLVEVGSVQRNEGGVFFQANVLDARGGTYITTIPHDKALDILPEDGIKAGQRANITITLGEGVVAAAYSTGYKLFSMPDREPLFPKPKPMVEVVEYMRDNALSPARPILTKIEEAEDV